MPREAIRRETGRDMVVESESDVGVVGRLRFMAEAARRWRTDLLKRADGSEGEGWGLVWFRGWTREVGRVMERRRLGLTFFWVGGVEVGVSVVDARIESKV